MKRYICAMMGVACIAMNASAVTIYVDDDAPPGGNGFLPATAFDTLQAGLDLAEELDGEDTIVVARGVYVPTLIDSDSESLTFRIDSAVTIVGGLDGAFEDPFETQESILDGQSTAKHVVVVRNDLDVAVTLRSIVITGGRANGMDVGAPVVPATQGGGIWTNSELTLLDCTIRANSASSRFDSAEGGGIFVDPLSSPPPPGVEALVRVIGCTFYGNTARGLGGAVSAKNTSFTNCLFYDNDALDPPENDPSGGGAIAGSVDIFNCTFADNTAVDGGGAIYVGQSGFTTVNNSILWGNSSPQTDDDAPGAMIVKNDTLDDVDPLFVPGANDYELLFDSPAKNNGNNAFLDADTEDIDGDGNSATETRPDLLLLPRAADGQVGQGAFEYCPYDLSGDGRVSFADLTALLNAWGPCPSSTLPCFADFVGDGSVGFADLTELLNSNHDPDDPSDGCPGYVPAGQGAMAGSGISPAFADDNALSIGAIATATANGQLTPQEGAEAIGILLASSAAQ